MRKITFKVIVSSLILLTASTSCKQTKSTAEKGDALAAHIDSTVKAGNDFFQYANGQWFKQNPIPASETAMR